MSDEEVEDRFGYEPPIQRQHMGGAAYLEKKKQLQIDYEPYDVPGKIKTDAIEIYLLVVSTTLKRGKRQAMMWKCLYESYKKNNIPKDPILLAKKCDVPINKLNKVQTAFATSVFELKLQKEFPKVHFTAVQLLSDVYQYFGVPLDDEIHEELHDVIDSMYRHHALLSRVAPRHITLVVFYWDVTRRRAYSVTREALQKDYHIAMSKIKSIMEILQEVLKNKDEAQDD
jgi:hypothetical protein